MKYYKISEKYLFQLLRDSKTIRGFDIDSETRFELYRVKGKRVHVPDLCGGCNFGNYNESENDTMLSDDELVEIVLTVMTVVVLICVGATVWAYFETEPEYFLETVE